VSDHLPGHGHGAVDPAALEAGRVVVANRLVAAREMSIACPSGVLLAADLRRHGIRRNSFLPSRPPSAGG
jgi:hypothetical protein